MRQIEAWCTRNSEKMCGTSNFGVGGRACPALETLEDRFLPSIFTVTNTNDSGDGSLRQAIIDANRGPFTNIIALTRGTRWLLV